MSLLGKSIVWSNQGVIVVWVVVVLALGVWRCRVEKPAHFARTVASLALDTVIEVFSESRRVT